MAKGYWIVGMDVVDQVKYDAYRAINGEALAKYEGRFLVRGGEAELRAGEAWSRYVVIEFPSLEAARACYDSPEYQKALAARADGAKLDCIIIEGYAGPQPA
jgi:uncharacterized protein (DUF1330 family)